MKIKTFLMDNLPDYNRLVIPYHLGKAVLAAEKYHFPGKKMRVIAVTGTNGKTSTCFLIWKMLNHAGYKTGLMTTVAWGVDKLEEQIEHMTTVDAETLNYRMNEIEKQGAEFLVLEVTSHALAQHRTFGVPIEIAVETNVTHEHLDYHKTFENYRATKARLFKMAKTGVINEDDGSWLYFATKVSNYITYGIKHGMLQAEEVEESASGVKYIVNPNTRGINHQWKSTTKLPRFKIETQIPGTFTVYNSLAATAVGLILGLSEEQIHDGIHSLESVEGRMNRIDEGQDFTAIVDYAHTPDAFLKVFEAIKSARTDKTKVISLFGGAGRRDESTREERGEIGAKNSDYIVITEDDSRDEDPQMIMEEFAKGAEKQGCVREKNLFLIQDRKEAIRKALSLAKKNDIVLVLGKGHEKTILRGDKAVPFEDIKVTSELLKEMQK